jgi:uncharacterized protein YecA (UPF0149 family)
VPKHIIRIVPEMFSDLELKDEKLRLEEKTQQAIEKNKTGRNERCPCGSGKKYKKCHGV